MEAALNRLSKLAASRIPVAVAVSGGPDSFALLHLLRTNSIECVSLTIDHNLRPESRDECQIVRRYCDRWNVPHVIHRIEWFEPPPCSHLQERARQRRWSGLTSMCRSLHLSNLLVAHTLDDQLETILLRLARSTSITGFGGMQFESELDWSAHCDLLDQCDLNDHARRLDLSRLIAPKLSIRRPLLGCWKVSASFLSVLELIFDN